MRTVVLGFCICAAAITAFAQPSVPKGGVLNSASYALQGLPNSGIAQGSIFVVFGTGLGPSTLQKISTFPIQTTLGGTSVQVTSGGTTVDALILYTTATQLAAILPSDTPAGSATLTVTYNGQTSSPADFQVVPSTFGIYSLNQAGNGPGVISDASYKVPALNKSLSSGQTVIIWGTGLGPVTGNEAGGPLPGDMSTLDVKVYVGGQQANLTYRGRSGCCAGLDQIGFVIPSGITGCRVPVSVTVGSTVSNFVTIPISANGAACVDPVLSSISSIDLSKLAAQGTVSFGSVGLERTQSTTTLPAPIGTQTTTIDTAFGSFEKVTYTQFNELQSPFGVTSTSYGSCTVSTFRGNSASIVDPITSSAVSLDAGAALTVTGPGGTKPVAKTGSGKTIVYDATLGGGVSPSTPLFLNAGSYSITAPGGSGTNAVGAFTANVTLPQPFTWTNASSISTVTRANGQLVKWSGGDPNGSVYIDGFSFLLGTNPNGSDTLGAIFICTAKVSDTQFNIPPNVLLSIPPSSTTSIGGLAFSFSSLSVSTGSYQSFTAPGIDVGIISAGSSSSETVTYQ